MGDADNPYIRAIDDLAGKIEEKMRPIREEMRMVNKLCELANLPPRYPEAETEASGDTLSLRRDQFFGKPLATVVREYLERRGASGKGGLGAATVNEIYDALISGGYKPDTDDVENAKRGLRIALTKNSATFYRVPSGAYGLLEWYPNARPQKPEDDAQSASPPGGKKKRGRPPKQPKTKKRGRPPKAKPSSNVIGLNATEPPKSEPEKDAADTKEASAA